MKKNNIFSNIFKKNILKAKSNKSIGKFANDVGELKGEVFIKAIDVNTGKVKNSYSCNTLTNLSKSAIIRLLSQGVSNNVGTIDPTQNKISKMRFSNNTTPASPDLIYNYYDISEAAYRDNPSPPVNVDRITNPYSIDANDSSKYEYDSVNDFGIFTTEIIGSRGPTGSPVTLKIWSNISKTQLLQTFTFNYPNFIKSGVTPSTVTNAGSGTVFAETTNENLNNIFYYDEDNDVWKVKLKLETSPVADVFTGALNGYAELTYRMGGFNVINSIVPINGTNAKSGVDFFTRYGRSTNRDYYQIGNNITYFNTSQDVGSAPPAKIEDFSVDFAISMAGEQGNGTGTVNYNEAFLMLENDEIFSALNLLGDSKEFTKDNSTAYFITWRITAPI